MVQSNKPISPLRQRMIEDMTLRKLNEKTQSQYIRAVVRLAHCLERAPDTATAEDLRLFQLHMAENGVSSITINTTLTGLKFFFTHTLDQPEVLKRVSRVYEPRKIPAVLTVQEVTRLLAAAGSLRNQAALSISYGSGLRASEVCHLKISDIDSERMILQVEEGKGQRDRYAMLSPTMLKILRAWYRDGRASGTLLSSGWLFPGQNPVNSMTPRQLNRIFHSARMDAQIDKHVSLHSLRHSFATQPTITTSSRSSTRAIGTKVVSATPPCSCRSMSSCGAS